jgi:hypothetical protein
MKFGFLAVVSKYECVLLECDAIYCVTYFVKRQRNLPPPYDARRLIPTARRQNTFLSSYILISCLLDMLVTAFLALS